MLAFNTSRGYIGTMNTPTNASPFQLDLTNTTRVAHRMFVVKVLSGGGYAHITKEVAQATITTGVVGGTIPAITLCNKTFTSGDAFESTNNDAIKVCKTCAAKAAK